MTELYKYYIAKKNTKDEYEKVLKKLSNKTTSREFFSTADGRLEPKRKKLHSDIIDQYLKKYSSQNKPYIHFIIGSIGSGKTSLKDTVVQQKEVKSFLYINFDEIKKQFPEYQLLKKLNPKRAAHFVQSESAKLAGTLYQKAVKKKINIIYEKNLRLNKENKLHLISEIKKVFKKHYDVSIHIVFLNSYQEAWRRVQLRYEKIKRYVSKKEVKNTFDCLFPNLNILLNQNFKAEHSIKFWYNGKWNQNLTKSTFGVNNIIKNNSTFDIPKKAYLIGALFFQKIHKLIKKNGNNIPVTVFKGVDSEGCIYSGFWTKKTLILPSTVKKKLMKLDYLKKTMENFT